MAFREILDLWILLVMPKTLDKKAGSLAALGSCLPSTPSLMNMSLYCGKSTLFVSQSTVCSTVQLCTSPFTQVIQRSGTVISVSFLWNSFSLLPSPSYCVTMVWSVRMLLWLSPTIVTQYDGDG